MKSLIFLVYFFCYESLNHANATSTTFDQNILNLSDSEVGLDESLSSSSNFQSILIAGTINYLGNKMFEAGYFYPLGLIPSNIFNLSPLAYFKNETNKKNLNLFYDCNKAYERDYMKRNKNVSKNYFDVRNCYKVIKINRHNDIKTLLDRYN